MGTTSLFGTVAVSLASITGADLPSGSTSAAPPEPNTLLPGELVAVGQLMRTRLRVQANDVYTAINEGGDIQFGKPYVIVGHGAPGHGSTGSEGDDVLPTKWAARNRYHAIRGDHPGVEFLAYEDGDTRPDLFPLLCGVSICLSSLPFFHVLLQEAAGILASPSPR